MVAGFFRLVLERHYVANQGWGNDFGPHPGPFSSFVRDADPNDLAQVIPRVFALDIVVIFRWLRVLAPRIS